VLVVLGVVMVAAVATAPLPLTPYWLAPIPAVLSLPAGIGLGSSNTAVAAGELWERTASGGGSAASASTGGCGWGGSLAAASTGRSPVASPISLPSSRATLATLSQYGGGGGAVFQRSVVQVSSSSSSREGGCMALHLWVLHWVLPCQQQVGSGHP
jgi:hypothetical protein